MNELKALDNIFAEDLEKSRNYEKDVISDQVKIVDDKHILGLDQNAKTNVVIGNPTFDIGLKVFNRKILSYIDKFNDVKV